MRPTKYSSNTDTRYLLWTALFVQMWGQSGILYICNDLPDVAVHFTRVEKVEASAEPSVPGFEPRTTRTLRE
jgi:hypothetical protein